MEHDFLYSFWVYFPVGSGNLQGWVHASHLKNPDPFTDPSKRFDAPGLKYGQRSMLPNAAQHTAASMGSETFKAKPIGSGE